tara:strand:- start:189 stop:428 length:240 start_codon:yes stop_codon:yes gene_type:complete
VPGLYSRRKAIREGIDWAKQSDYDPREHKKQGYDARLDESLGERRGKESTKSQSYKARRDESKGAEKAAGKRAYQSIDK